MVDKEIHRFIETESHGKAACIMHSEDKDTSIFHSWVSGLGQGVPVSFLGRH
jgi:hypothetical protein